MFINNLSKRERHLALATLSVVSIAVLYIFIAKPIMTGWKNFNNEIQSKITMIAKDFKILANQKTIESEYAKLSKYAKSGKSDEEAVAELDGLLRVRGGARAQDQDGAQRDDAATEQGGKACGHSVSFVCPGMAWPLPGEGTLPRRGQVGGDRAAADAI